MPARDSIGVRELKTHTTEILRQVREKGVEIQVTYRGRVIARLIPVRQPQRVSGKRSAVWTDLDRLAAEIGVRWTGPAHAVDAVRAGRRDL